VVGCVVYPPIDGATEKVRLEEDRKVYEILVAEKQLLANIEILAIIIDESI